MKTKHRFSIWWVPGGIGLLILVCLIILIVRRKPEPEPPPVKLTNVEVITLEPREFHETLELPARIIADRAVSLSAETSGRLDSWLVEEGAEVAAGDVLAVVNDDELSAQLEEARARLSAAEAGVDAARRQLDATHAALLQSRMAVKSAKLALASSESDLEFRRKEYDRVKELCDQEIVSKSALDAALNDLNQASLSVDRATEGVATAEQAVASAEAAVGSAEAAVALAESQSVQSAKSLEWLEVQLEKTRIKAPFAGRMDKHLVEEGGLLAPGTVVTTVYDMDHVRAVVNVGDRYVSFLEDGNNSVSDYLKMTLPGAEQSVTSSIILPGMPKLTGGTYAGVELDAEIARVAQASDPLSNTFEVELRIENPGQALKQGIIVKARLGFLVYRDALVVPLRSVSVTDSGTRVLVAESRDNSTYARVRSVVPLSIREEEVLVRGELRAGDRIIVVGGKGVVDGEEVRILVSDGEVVAMSGTGRG